MVIDNAEGTDAADASLPAENDRSRAILRAIGTAALMLATPSWTRAVGDVLDSLGRATGVQRVFLFEIELEHGTPLSATLSREWTAPGVASQLTNPLLQRIGGDGRFGSLGEQLDSGAATVLRAADGPPAVREIFEAIGTSSILVVPILAGGQRVGVIGFDAGMDDRTWNEDEVVALSTTAGIIGTAILHRRSLDSLRSRDAILEAVTFAAERFLLTGNVEAALLEVLEQLGHATDATRVAAMARRDTGDGVPRMSRRAEWEAEGIAPLIESSDPGGFPYFPRWATLLESGTLIAGLVRDFPEEERTALEADGVRSLLLAPVIVGGEWWGHIGFDDSRTDRHWTEPEIEALRAAAGIIGAGIQRERAMVAARERSAILRTVADAATVLLGTPDWRPALAEILADIRLATGTATAFAYEIDPASSPAPQMGHLLSIDPPEPRPARILDTFEILPSIVARLRSGEVLNDDIVRVGAAEARAAGAPAPTDSWIALPILASGELWGLMGLDTLEPRPWSAGEIDALRIATSAIGAVIERERHDQSLQVAEDRLRRVERMEAVGRLAGGLAHDFGNLLTAILGNAEFLVTEAHTTREREDAQAVIDAAQQGAGLIRQLMSFSRQRVGEPRPVDLNELVERMHRMLERVVGVEITMVLQLDPGRPTVLADPSQLEQILVNLVVNARDAMPTGGTLTIATATAANGRSGVLRVVDTGTGMDEATRARIFEPLFTTKAEGQGTGFGLATADAVVSQLGGRIEVATALGAGTTFSIVLPR